MFNKLIDDGKTTFCHDGKVFEIRQFNDDKKITIKVFYGEKQVSPAYSVDTEVAQDFFAPHANDIIDSLGKIACDDIKRGMYLK